MSAWRLNPKDLKQYPHFDPIISRAKAEALATDPVRVAQHQFFPFMRYVQRWTKFAKKGEKGKTKERPIRFAARRDAYIFSYYRFLLSQKYEAELTRLELSDKVLAYRRIPAEGGGGKCNIHFARDAFGEVQRMQRCCVLALDISGYFESLDHERLKVLWCRLLGVGRLPPDHHHVFKAITKYAVVDKQEVYQRLGHYGEKRKSRAGIPINGYLTPYKKVPKQLCDGKQFRSLIAGTGTSKGIIRKNAKPYGIPQGAPISDLLANLYLIEFDRTVAQWAKSMGGAYFRYSDDILLVLPGDETVGYAMMDRVRNAIRSFGNKLKIKKEKTAIFVFEEDGVRQKFRRVYPDGPSNGLEYLGFRFDGRAIYLRDSTLSNLYRKIALAARREANACARRYADKGELELRSLFPYERLVKRFGRVEQFGELHDDYRKWTFWTYATRAAKVLGPMGKSIARQLSKHRKNIRSRTNHEIHRAVERRSRAMI